MKIHLEFDPNDSTDRALAIAFIAGPAAPTTAPTAPAGATIPSGPVATIVPTNQPDWSDLDSASRPWDGRIHQKAKKKLMSGKNAGQWKTLKALERDYPGLQDQVEAELDAARPGVPEVAATLDTQPAPGPAPDAAAIPPAPPASPRKGPPVAPPLNPEHQAIVDKIQRVIGESPVPTPGAYVQYGIDNSLEHAPAVMALLNQFNCSDVNEIASIPEHWEGLQGMLDYVWPQ